MTSIRSGWMPRLLIVAAASAAALSLSACQPEPAATPSGDAGAASSSPITSAVPSTSPSPTPEPTSTFALPVSCDGIYSDDMRARLESENPPLNDPGVTMLSSENAVVLETLDSGAPTLRCTWGGPSEYGLATNVTVVDAAQAAEISEALSASGFSEEALGSGTVHRIEQRGITMDDEPYTLGETHYIGDGAVVTTRWVNFAPEGYTEDIVATLWG